MTTVQAYVFKIAQDCDADGLTEELPPSSGGDPSFTCTSNCAIADWNSSGSVSVQDIFDFLAHYFLNCTGVGVSGNPPVTQAACLRSADVDQSGTVGVQDIFDFLFYYFTATHC